MTIRHWIAGVIGLSISTSALASDWWLVGLGGSKPRRVVTLIDKDTVRPMPASKVRFWTWSYYEDRSDNIGTGKYLNEVDCNEQTMRTLSSLTFTPHGDVVKSSNFSIYESQATPVSPGSVGQTELMFICQNGTTGTTQVGEVSDLENGGAGLLRLYDSETASGRAKR